MVIILCTGLAVAGWWTPIRMTRGVRLLLAENTTNTSGHQAALLWEKGNHNCESLVVMSAIILIKNNLPPSLSSLLFPLRSFTVFLSRSALTLHVIDALCILLLASYAVAWIHRVSFELYRLGAFDEFNIFRLIFPRTSVILSRLKYWNMKIFK